MKVKRLFSGLFMVVVLCAFVAGCSTGSSSTPTSPSSTNNSTSFSPVGTWNLTATTFSNPTHPANSSILIVNADNTYSATSPLCANTGIYNTGTGTTSNNQTVYSSATYKNTTTTCGSSLNTTVTIATTVSATGMTLLYPDGSQETYQKQ